MAKREGSARLVEVHAWSADVHGERLCAVLHGVAADGSPLRVAVDMVGLFEAATSLELKIRAIGGGALPSGH